MMRGATCITAVRSSLGHSSHHSEHMFVDPEAAASVAAGTAAPAVADLQPFATLPSTLAAVVDLRAL